MSQDTKSSSPRATSESTWVGAAGAAKYDMISDVRTTPTPSMLAAITRCSLLDDVSREDTTTRSLESHCAALTGKAAGLFVLSGTMGNQLALRTLLTQPPHSILCDRRAHIFRHEAGGCSSLSGAMVLPVVPKNGVYLTLEDVKANVMLGDDVHVCTTRVISLENTLNGTIMPLAEVRRIAAFARENGIKMHLDGARLWEVVASHAAEGKGKGEGGDLADWVGEFDTATLCFSKGLGAPCGSMLVGSEEVCKHARWVRKSIGGGLRQAGVLTAAARVAVDETFGKGGSGESGMLGRTHVLAKEIESIWNSLGGKVTEPVQTNMVWLDLEAAGVSEDAWEAMGREVGLGVGNRLVIHYQIWQNREDTVPKLKKLFERVLGKTAKARL